MMMMKIQSPFKLASNWKCLKRRKMRVRAARDQVVLLKRARGLRGLNLRDLGKLWWETDSFARISVTLASGARSISLRITLIKRFYQLTTKYMLMTFHTYSTTKISSLKTHFTLSTTSLSKYHSLLSWKKSSNRSPRYMVYTGSMRICWQQCGK